MYSNLLHEVHFSRKLLSVAFFTRRIVFGLRYTVSVDFHTPNSSESNTETNVNDTYTLLATNLYEIITSFGLKALRLVLFERCSAYILHEGTGLFSFLSRRLHSL